MTSHEAITSLPEPRARALIACQIQAGPGRTWTDRTYEVVRAPDGQWLVDFGEGPREPRRDWRSVLDWLWRLSPRDVELGRALESMRSTRFRDSRGRFKGSAS